jgi:gluconate 2-dehydrogenase gamma chain
MTAVTGMNRRELLQRALLLVGASVLPVGDPVHADSKAEKWEIGQAQLALIAAVAGTIIPKTDTPGAVEAGVPQHFVDMLRTWASPTRRVELIQAFDRIDEVAQRQRGRHFTDLTPSERYELLAAHDMAALPVDPAYVKLKELVVVLFYLSETALTHELVYEHTPGEWKPSVPVTPETRAVGGIGSL